MGETCPDVAYLLFYEINILYYVCKKITESGAIIGGRSISNLRYADETALCGKSPQEINNIVHKVNDAGRIRLLKLNARKTKLMVIGDENANVSIDVDG